MKLRKKATRRLARLRLEALEDRTLLSSSVIESFEPGSLANYQAAIRNNPGYNLTAQILPIAAHDGSNGLVKQDDYDWLVGNNTNQVHQGDTLSVWVQMADVADGRAYLGFDAKNTGAANSPLSQSGGLSVVMAANTNQLLLESHTGGNGIANFSTVASASQTYEADKWYRLEVTWGSGGAITGRLYDSDGTTQLNTVSGTTTAPFPTGGAIAFRAFGHDKYFDTVVLDTNSEDTPAQRVAVDPGLDPGWTPGNPPAPVTNGPSGGPAPVPWAYTSDPGSGIEVQLAAFNQLQQVPSGGIVNGVVGLAAMNNSLITGTRQVGWGDPLETPLLAQYLFRQRPGETTQLIGASSVKHFFSSAHADSQHLNPGENDTYGAGLNMTQSLYTDGSELDPVTGTLHSPIDRGSLNADGMVVNGSRTFANNIQELLQVNVADLDPAQNPAGTRWFLMGNLFVDGEQDVTQASRWVEIVPSFNGTTFSFTYPNGSGGQLDFHTIPGLVQPAGPSVTNATPSGDNFGTVSSVRVTFDRPINVSTFDLSQVVSFTRTVGDNTTDLSGALQAVNPVNGSNGRSFDITFTTQSALGDYRLVIGPNILDTDGNAMDQNQNGTAGEVPDDEFTAEFSLQGPKVINSTPTGNNNLPGQISGVTLTFNEPINPATLTTDQVFAFRGPNGFLPINAVTVVGGTNNTQFRVSFDPVTATGTYSFMVGPDVRDVAGHQMDQNGNFIDGEVPGDIYTATFGVQGLKVTSATLNPNSPVPGQPYSVRVVFNEAVDLSTFDNNTVASAVTLIGPDGSNLSPFGVVPVGSDFKTFDVLFAPLTAAGSYTAIVGPNIADVYGNLMDQDGDLVPGESTDVFTNATNPFTVTGPSVIAASPTGTVEPVVDHVRLTFNEPMDPSSFSPDQVSLTGPGGSPIDVTGVTAVPFGNNTQFDITFAPQALAGGYTLVLNGGAQDIYGNTFAGYTTQFSVAAFRVLNTNPSGSVPANTDHVRVTFDRPADLTTFGTDQVTLTGPGGTAITVTGVAAVDGSNDTQFDISFTPLTVRGGYSLVLSSDIQDIYGNSLAASPISLAVTPSYTASATTFQNLEIFGQAGTQTLHFGSATGPVTADDDFGTINLGAGNTFNFYGTTYNQLFVSSNGLITFGSGNSSYHATNLAGNPTQAAIAPYWTDLFKSGTEPMIVWRIDNNKLIIEWYHVSTFDDRSLSMTFQAILDLNTGGNPGNIVFNYSNVSGTGDGPENVGVTVGVKDAGTVSTVARTLVEDGTTFSSTGDSRVQTGHAILLTAT